ncbi:Asp23/Gls24 family envelope stress response protein [Melissococcus plutonius]|uniref:Asp23/Gls24 family envelope stress response protein n=1 Tax=Melissococcus plutonius TaxID=33970 RepID=UPI003C2B7D3F
MDNKTHTNSNDGANKTNDVKKKLTFDDQVLKKIAGIAVSSIPGILGLSGNAITNLTDKFTNNNNPTKGVNAEVGSKQVAIDLDIIGEYGKNIAEVFDEATKKVADSVKNMTGLELVEFNMNVDDVMSKQQYEEQYQNKKPKDNKKDNKKEDNQNEQRNLQ